MIRQFLASLALGCCALAAHAANPQVEIRTSLGNIVLELDEERAPKTVANFLQYVQDGHYNGTIFHRVIAGFMIQGGGMDQALKEKPTRAPIENEAQNGLKNQTGTVAMARTSAPHSASAQFFINVADNSALDYPSPDNWGYAVFGKVVKGMDVVLKIAKLPTTTMRMHRDVPASPVVIEVAHVIEKAPEPSTPAPAPAPAKKSTKTTPTKPR